MQRILLCLLNLGIYLPGCKKTDNASPVTPWPNGPASSVYTSPKMNGSWICIGTSSSSSTTLLPPDAFIRLNITVLDNSTVIVGDDTLRFKSIDDATHTALFYLNADSISHRLNEDRLYYNSINDTMAFQSYRSHSFGGSGIDVSTAPYKPNPSVGSYVSSIAGTKTMSGPGYDTLLVRTPVDSNYFLNTSMNFARIDDSTIGFDNDILKLGDKQLHYKSTDYSTNTVIFQNFHTYDYELSTLTYNYVTGQIIFEQRLVATATVRYIRLQ